MAVGDCHNTPVLSACRCGTNAFKAVCFSSEKSLIIFYLNVICKVSSEREREAVYIRLCYWFYLAFICRKCNGEDVFV